MNKQSKQGIYFFSVSFVLILSVLSLWQAQAQDIGIIEDEVKFDEVFDPNVDDSQSPTDQNSQGEPNVTEQSQDINTKNTEQNNSNEANDIIVEPQEDQVNKRESIGTNNEEAIQGLDALEKTLDYGIDSSVLETITTLQQLNTTQFSDKVLNRIRSSTNDDVRIGGIQYFRHFKDSVAIPFVIRTLADYETANSQLIRQLIFYIKDFYEELESTQVATVLEYIDKIIASDNTTNVLVALELLPFLYSEKDIAYDAKIATQVAGVALIEEHFDNTIILSEDTATKTESNQYSQQLKEYYDKSLVQTSRAAILHVLGKMQAYNMIDSLINIAQNEAENVTIRIAAIKALGAFEKYPNKEIEENIIALFNDLRNSDQAAIRQAVFVSITSMKYLNIYDASSLNTWILNGVRDDESDVRIATLQAIKNILDKNPYEIENIDFFPFMIENDIDSKVKKVALNIYVDLEKRDEGKEYLLSQIQTIQNINAKNRAILHLAFKKIDELHTISPIVQLSAKSINKKFSFLLQVLSEIASGYSHDGLIDLAKVLIRSVDSQVVYNTLNLIAKNRMYKLSGYVHTLTRDRSKSFKVRVRSSQVLEILLNPGSGN